MAVPYAFCGNDAFAAALGERLAQSGYERTSDVAAADVVFTHCMGQSALEELYFGDDGIVKIAAPHTLVIDFSATTPSFARELNAVATVSDLRFVEAPFSFVSFDTEKGYQRDHLLCYVAGDEDVVDQATDVLDVLFGHTEIKGRAGSAQLAKAVRTLQAAAMLVSSIEALSLAQAVRRQAGVMGFTAANPDPFSSANNDIMNEVVAEHFDGAYTAEMLLAELSAAMMCADDAELIIPQAESAMHLLELLAVIGGANKAPTALALVYGDEESCARNGLDWTRAEAVYGNQHGDHDDFEDDYDDDFDDFDTFGDDSFDDFDFSSN